MDYVVVHELAHLIEFNHSSRFWAIVEGILPDYKARRQSLKEVQESLLRQGW
jgi:predicted metal-dependent hydrolase